MEFKLTPASVLHVLMIIIVEAVSKEYHECNITTCDWPNEPLYGVHASDCSKYIQCTPNGPVEMACLPGTRWHPELLTCHHGDGMPCSTGCSKTGEAAMSEIKITALSEPHDLGEGPIWIEKDKALMYVDAFQGVVHRHFPETGRHQMLTVEKEAGYRCVSIVIPVEGESDLYIVSTGRCLGTVRWPLNSANHTTVKADLLYCADDHFPLNHFNDGKCDPRGRLWVGTKGHESSPGNVEMERGTLYRLDSQLEFTHTGVDKVSITNGMAWSHDRKTFYYIDSPLQLIYAFDYDDNEGKISNRRVLLDLKSKPETSSSYPDGMTIDNDGNLWVACFHGKQVICIDPRKDGDIVRIVEMPASQVTSVTFGGPDYGTLYVTTAFRGHSEEERNATPQAGCTFAITGLGIQGSPPISFKADQEILKAFFSRNNPKIYDF